MSSVSEYQFRPSGHGAPGAKRSYSEPGKKLRAAFERWLEDDNVFRVGSYASLYAYEKALGLIQGMELSVPEAHALLLHYEDHRRIWSAGIFLSAIYNKVPDKEIFLDLELEIFHIGYKLPEWKILVNDGIVGGNLGINASGIVINYGNAKHQLGSDASVSSSVINYGETRTFLGDQSKGLVVNMGTLEGYVMGSNCLLLDFRRPGRYIVVEGVEPAWNPGTLRYLGQLREKFEEGRNDYAKVVAFLKEMGPSPRTRIAANIKRAAQVGHEI